ISRSASEKSRVTSLSVCTVRNGPKGVGAGSPRISTRKAADAPLSCEWTMVWLSLMLILAIPLMKIRFVIRFLRGNIRKGRARGRRTDERGASGACGFDWRGDEGDGREYDRKLTRLRARRRPDMIAASSIIHSPQLFIWPIYISEETHPC